MPSPVARPPFDAERFVRRLRTPTGPCTRVVVRDRETSTSTVLATAVKHGAGWRAPAVLLADHQVAGRGRVERSWMTPAGAAITMSVLLDPRVTPLTWLPLLAGLAVCEAVSEASGLDAVLKWPNDVLVPVPGSRELPVVGRRRKIAGILAQAVSPGVVVGLGVNVGQRENELPVAQATSLALAAPHQLPPTPREDLAAEIVERLCGLVGWWEHGGNVAAAVRPWMSTLGRRVRVELSGEDAVGRAIDLAPGGGLVLEQPDGSHRVVVAGDVHHLRDLD